jgi:hypothetical protein
VIFPLSCNGRRPAFPLQHLMIVIAGVICGAYNEFFNINDNSRFEAEVAVFQKPCDKVLKFGNHSFKGLKIDFIPRFSELLCSPRPSDGVYHNASRRRPPALQLGFKKFSVINSP